MNAKKTALVAGSSIAILVAGASVAAKSSLAANTSSDNLASRIATVFGLDQSKVQSTIDTFREEERQNRQTEMKQKLTDRLTQAVTDGKLSEDQKNTILNKEAEIQARLDEAMKISDETNRKTALDTIHTDTEAWLNANTWAKAYLHGPGFDGPGRPGGRGHRGMMGEGMGAPPDLPSNTSTN